MSKGQKMVPFVIFGIAALGMALASCRRMAVTPVQRLSSDGVSG
jgi:hypothetical protein